MTPAVDYARTYDGWNLALHRHHGDGRALPPVILCGGYGCNRHFFDFDDRYSLARFLARRGADVWVLELRGRGRSVPALPETPRGWTFDDLARFDVPAAIRHVRERSGHRPPVWVGHSMGGMVAYAAVGREPSVGSWLSGLVTVASPVGSSTASSRLARLIGERIVPPGVVPQRLAIIGLWWLLRSRENALRYGMNPDNTDVAAFGRALRRFICNVPSTKLRQFIRWSLTGAFDSVDGRIDYRAGLRRIATPTLVVAGAADRLAPPAQVRAGFEAIGSARKVYREFGVRHGDSADYGHVDLVFGRRAPEEVFATVAAWIEDTEG